MIRFIVRVNATEVHGREDAPVLDRSDERQLWGWPRTRVRFRAARGKLVDFVSVFLPRTLIGAREITAEQAELCAQADRDVEAARAALARAHTERLEVYAAAFARGKPVRVPADRA